MTGASCYHEVRSELYAAFLSWEKETGVATVSAKKFAKHLKSRGVTPVADYPRTINARIETEFVRYRSAIRSKDHEEVNPLNFSWSGAGYVSQVQVVPPSIRETPVPGG